MAVVGSLVAAARGANPDASLVDDRRAVELVYYQHRTGTKPLFEQVLPTAELEKLVALESKKESVLKHVYGVQITDAMVEAEVRRINETTRAPDVLLELKAALGDDPGRFARAIARPIVVERTLRARFENDDKLHAAERGKVAALRTEILGDRNGTYANRLAIVNAAQVGAAPELTWQLSPRPASDLSPAPPGAPSVLTEVKARSSAYSIEATAQLAQVLASPDRSAVDRDRMLYFEDLPAELQDVLRTQLRKPGDVSAVIETTQGFLLYLAKERTAGTLVAACVSVPKRGFEEWLASMQN